MDSRKRILLVGSDTSNSVSPRMHNSALRLSGLGETNRYEAVNVSEGDIEKIFEKIRSGEILGANVTMPFKETAFNLVDRRSPEAEMTGSVNTVALNDGILWGHNTDYGGFLDSLREAGMIGPGSGNTRNMTKTGISVNKENKVRRAIVIGTGGTARTAAFALAGIGFLVMIAGRSIEKAGEIATRVAGIDSGRCGFCSLEDVKKHLNDGCLVVNCTPFGSRGAMEGRTPIDVSLLQKDMGIFDAVYNPERTILVKEARRMGCSARGGLDMLARQAALSFRIWTGIEPKLEYMLIQGKLALRGNICLVGFMGAGKTTVGKLLSSKLGMEFVDTDRMVEESTGKSIEQIFAREGEEAFRRHESDAVRTAFSGKNRVIACGGGVVLKDENLEIIGREAVSVWLKVSPAEASKHLQSTSMESGQSPRSPGHSPEHSPGYSPGPHGTAHRPLLAGAKSISDLSVIMNQLMDRRQDRYRQAADLEVETDGRNIGEIADEIAMRLGVGT